MLVHAFPLGVHLLCWTFNALRGLCNNQLIGKFGNQCKRLEFLFLLMPLEPLPEDSFPGLD